jgi:hypothetical protein
MLIALILLLNFQILCRLSLLLDVFLSRQNLLNWFILMGFLLSNQCLMLNLYNFLRNLLLFLLMMRVDNGKGSFEIDV